MKKVMTLVVLMAFSLTIDAQSSKRGDLNGDGLVSIADVMQLINIIIYGDYTQVPSYRTCPDNNHPHLIDLDLPSGTKWACCNVGATDPESYGGYYAWGEVLQKDSYDWAHYLHADGSESACHYLADNISSTEYDVVVVKWGTQWQMPTNEQFVELLSECTYEWTTLNGISGARFTSPNGGSVFFPATGTRQNAGFFDCGSLGTYWSSTPNTSNASNAYYFYFLNDGNASWANDARCYGMTIRAVAGQTTYPLHLSPASLEMQIGSEATVEVATGTGFYSAASDNESVATVTVNGSTVSVTAVGIGTATVTVTDTKNHRTGTFEVTVDYIPLALSATSLPIDLGETSIVNVTSGMGSYTAESSDPNVATVTVDGNKVKVNTVATGTATITVTDTQSGQTATFEVTVDYKPLTLVANSQYLIPTEKKNVRITSGMGDYTAESSDESIVTASITSGALRLIAVAVGTATVTVTDTQSGQTATIEVTVQSTPKSYKKCPDENHPHLIDLGLPSGTKWSCCNVGANQPEGYGAYYAWGETKKKTEFTWKTYTHCDGTENTCHDIGTSISGTKYDVAHSGWGGNWQIPTTTQYYELLSNSNFEWTTLDGINGYKITSKKNNSWIFLPASGYYSETSGLIYRNERGHYLLGNYNSTYKYLSYGFWFANGVTPSRGSTFSRCEGNTIRPVAQ